MKKELPNLTKQERIHFLINCRINNLEVQLKECKKAQKYRNKIEIISAISNGALIGGSIAFWSPISFILIGCALGAFTFTTLGINHLNNSRPNKLLMSYSNDKINYRTYTELKKSGEIAKWQQEYEKEIAGLGYTTQRIETKEYFSSISSLKSYQQTTSEKSHKSKNLDNDKSNER